MDTENLQFVIQRIDNNINNTNNKSTILLGINTFVLGGIASNYHLVNIILHINLLCRILVIVSLIGLMASSLFSIMSIKPMFKSKKVEKHPDSLIFYGAIALFNGEEYYQKCKAQDIDYDKDLCMQILENSKIAKEKFDYQISAVNVLVYMVGIPWASIITIMVFGGLV